jgi:hypothetical protein
MSFLRRLQSFVGMFQGLFGMLMSGQVIFFPVMYGGCAVRVGREFMELCCSLMRIVGHSDFRPYMPRHAKTIPFSKLSKKRHSRRVCGLNPLMLYFARFVGGQAAHTDGARTRPLP